MSSMHEEELWRPIFTVFRGLLLAHLCQIPEHYSTVVAARGKDGFFEWMPFQSCHAVIVPFKNMQLVFEVSQIPNCNSLICTPCRNHGFHSQIESDGVDCVSVLVLS